jgi:hypothetical protein
MHRKIMQTAKHLEIVSRSSSAGNGIVVSAYVGSDVRDVAAAMEELARAEGVPVRCELNGINLHADDSSAADAIYQAYRDEFERRCGPARKPRGSRSSGRERAT